jgi:protein-S-isoprenylcysteine O-methyltransferase Ste14
MSWLPDLELGFLNAWLLTCHPMLFPILMVALDNAGIWDVGKKMTEVPYQGREKSAFMTSLGVMFILVLYSVFLPLQPGTVRFYAGLALYLVGLLPYLAAVGVIATTPRGQPWTRGIYRFSRHPMTVSTTIAWTGASLAAGSWILLVLSLVSMALQKAEATAEERGCLEIYGDEYRGYLDRTPRWIGLPKSR